MGISEGLKGWYEVPGCGSNLCAMLGCWWVGKPECFVRVTVDVGYIGMGGDMW